MYYVYEEKPERRIQISQHKTESAALKRAEKHSRGTPHQVHAELQENRATTRLATYQEGKRIE